MNKTLKVVNKLCSDNMPLIQTVGIFAGLIVLGFTAFSIYITGATFKLNLQQQKPSFDFITNNEKSTIEIKTLTSDIRLERVTIFCPENFFDESHRYHIPSTPTIWRIYPLRIFLKKSFAQIPKPGIGFARMFPFCIVFYYEQFGKSKRFIGLYYMEYSLSRLKVEEPPKIGFQNIYFIKELFWTGRIQSELDKLSIEMGLKDRSKNR